MIKNIASLAIKRLKEDKLRLVMFIIFVAFNLFSSVYFLVGGYFRNAVLPIAYAALFIVVLALFEYFLNMHAGMIFLMIMFFMPVGGILGTGYELYMIIPSFDTILHIIAGFIMAPLGYSIMDYLLRKKGVSSRLCCVLFALAFSLAVAVLWEMFEWALTVLMNGDMEEDSIITDIRSYLLSGSHNESVDILDITKTEIYYGDGLVYTIEGGYLDVGLLDTLVDMLVCTIGAVIFAVIAVVDKFVKFDLLGKFVPKCNLELSI